MKYIEQLYPHFTDKYKNLVPPWGPCGYVTYKRTYARRLVEDDKDSPTEEWYQTITRCVNGLLEIGTAYTQEEAETLFDDVFHLRGIFSGRHLWQLGTKAVRERGGDSLQSCWVVKVNDYKYPFLFTFDKLMVGGGVGFNIQREYVYEIPPVKFNPIIERVDTYDCDLIVTDNREGWCELLGRILDAFFINGKPLRYCPNCIRDRGRLIKSFGGIASGSENLVNGMDLIIKILRGAVGRKLTTVDCLDIMNIIGMIVVAGNVRRSAEIAIGDPDDKDFLSAKNWSEGIIPRWRQQSNNTVSTDYLKKLSSRFWKNYETNERGETCGEPYGLFNPHTCRNYGRLVDGFTKDLDALICGCNPCAEIPEEDSEPCNLADNYLPNLKDASEWKRIGGLLLKAQKSISLLPFTHDRTNEVVGRNHRLGQGITGWQNAQHLWDKEILDQQYKYLREVDKEYSKLKGCKESIKITTVKPSGTVSLLPDKCPSGANGAFARYVSRGILFSADDPILKKLKDNGYKVEPKQNIDGSHDYNSMFVSFPIDYGPDAITDRQLNAKAQLDTQKKLQTYYVDNSVSMTVQYKSRELPGIKDWQKDNYHDNVKTVSFCLHDNHGFPQAPFREITEREYKAMSAKIKPITRIIDHGNYEISSDECASGACPAR